MNNDGKIQRFNRKWKFDVYAVDGHRSVQLLQLNRESQRTREKKSIEAMLAVCVCVTVGTEGAFSPCITLLGFRIAFVFAKVCVLVV